MKKRFLGVIFSVVLFFSAAQVFGLEPPSSFKEYMLSNGMSVFVYEDFSTPIIRVEYSAKAGFSKQDADNTGYFPLYAELFTDAGKYSIEDDEIWLLDEIQSECNADSTRFIIDVTGAELQGVFEQLSACAFAPIFNDQALQEKFEETKNRVKQDAFSIEGFINGAIDSRVFAQSPWKHDSGIYPALFENKSLYDVRQTLNQISKKYYSPQNSALFVSGAVNAQTALFIAEQTFGRYAPSTYSIPNLFIKDDTEEPLQEQQRKFVLSDAELSPDMAQVVVQYTSLTMEQADIAAVILNARNSSLKKALTQNAELNIRGSDYINADAAHKNGSSRLIIQTLMEKTDVSAFEQSAAFEDILENKVCDFTEDEFHFAKEFLVENFEDSIKTAAEFMNLFSQFWAVEQQSDKTLLERFLMRSENIMSENYSNLKAVLQNENAWIFVLLNSKTYSPLQESFTNLDYQNVTAKNGSWYTQELYAKIKNALQEDTSEEENELTTLSIYEDSFIGQHKNSTESALLSNGIRITVKTTPNTKRTAIAFYIDGGDSFDCQQNYGMEAIVASVLAQHIPFSSQVLVNETNAVIILDCAAEQSISAIEGIGRALLYSEFAPATVDFALSDKRVRQIIKTGGLNNQLFAAGVKHFYSSPIYRALYSNQKDILKGIKYNDVLEAYQKLLDANRLEIIASGNVQAEEFFAECECVFGNLRSLKALQEGNEDLYKSPQESQRNSLRTRLEHTFLTDVSGDKAGPRPAVLIPTTDFSDPVQYWIKAPAAFEKQSAIFDALLLELESIFKKNIRSDKRFSKMTVRLEEKSVLVSFGAITIFNVKNVSDADSLFENSLLELDEILKNSNSIDAIKSRWIKKHYKETYDNTESVKTISQKIGLARLGNIVFDAENAVTEDYETVCLADEEDFIEVFENYFGGKTFKIYSADSKN